MCQWGRVGLGARGFQTLLMTTLFFSRGFSKIKPLLIYLVIVIDKSISVVLLQQAKILADIVTLFNTVLLHKGQ